jgi:glycosyltransferase involved in cell wall biosynthesis
MKKFSGKAGIQQRVVPFYRAEFFDTLAKRCEGGLEIFAGDPRPDEGIKSVERLQFAQLSKGRNLHLFPINSPFYICWQIGSTDWLQEKQPDVLVVEANPRYLQSRSLVDWMHKKNRSVIGWGLGAPEIRGIFSGMRAHHRKRFLSTLDAVISYSNKGAKEYIKSGVPESKVFVAPNAAATKRLSTPPIRGRIITGKLCVLFVGRLQKRKQVDNLIRACSLLPDEIKPSLVIVGDGPVKQELIELAEVIYPETDFPGALYGQDLENQFLQADLFVLPGTGGLAVQQAMSYGLPVIMGEGDGTQSELIRDKNGWVIPTNDLSVLRSTLLRALTDVPRLRLMGNESYRIVKEEINIERMADAFVDVFSNVLAANQKGLAW